MNVNKRDKTNERQINLLRVVFVGSQKIGYESLKKVIQLKNNVVAVYTIKPDAHENWEKSVDELAEKYKTSLLAVEQQLKKGIKVEMEHTKKHSVAKEIALDHLGEDLYYYKKLGKIEKTDESCGPECTCPKCKGKKKG